MSGPAPWDYQPERFPVSDQSPPSEHDQLGWLMGEVDRVRAELEQARKAAEAEAQLANEYHAELEQARKERDEFFEEARTYWALVLEAKSVVEKAQRYRDALVRVMGATTPGEPAWDIASDAVGGK